jgi:hypothetical protein
MEYDYTEISDLYKVYPNNDNFIVYKTNINHTPFRIEDAQSNRSNPFISVPEGGILNENWCIIEWETNLYDVYPKNDDFLVDTPFRIKDADPSVQQPYRYTKMSNRKYRIFLETEYLEGLYQEISIFMTANKAITMEATSGVNLPNMTCIIPVEYPLVPPFVYMNNVLYMNKIYCCHLERVKLITLKYSKSYRNYTNCISCACILKNGNWKEKTMFSDILSEWRQIKRMKRIVGYELALDDLILYRDLDYYNFIHIMEYLVEL